MRIWAKCTILARRITVDSEHKSLKVNLADNMDFPF